MNLTNPHPQLAKEQSFLCPVHVSLHFSENGLKKITLEEAQTFQLFFLGAPPKKQEIIDWFFSFFKGVFLPFPIPLIAQLGNFTWKVLQQLQKIPLGKTQTYQQIARQLNNPRAARAVGNACKENPFPLLFPCHRVVKTGGALGGFAYGCKLKASLLDFETTLWKNSANNSDIPIPI